MNDNFFQALASPYRREIIRLLKWKTLSAGEIAARFDISQPSVSRHLDILKRAGIVTAERRANQIFYALNLSVLQEFLLEAAVLFEYCNLWMRILIRRKTPVSNCFILKVYTIRTDCFSMLLH